MEKDKTHCESFKFGVHKLNWELIENVIGNSDLMANNFLLMPQF